MDRIISYIAVFLALMVVLPVHEFAHAFVADKCGDKTPRSYGRLTLNPLSHVDVYGLVALVLVHFGWGKPVPVNPYNFRRRKLGSVLVSIAGVVANYILAFLTVPLVYLLFYIIIPDFGYFDDLLILTVLYIPELCLTFFVFNMLPIYPLDGFKLFETLNGGKGKIYRFLRDYGHYILLGLIFLGIIANNSGVYQLDILGMYVSWASDLIAQPIYAFWGLIF